MTLAAAGALAAMVTTTLGAIPQPSDSVALTLARRFGLTAAERDRLAAGREVVRALPSSAPDGVAAMGAIHVAARPDTYLRWAEAFADFDRGAAVQIVRRLSSPPVPADFDGLVLSNDDLRELARCRAGACAMQLDEDTIGRIAAIDWRRPGAGATATTIVRAMMLDVAFRSLAPGPVSLPSYRDTVRATDVNSSWASLVEEEARARLAPPVLLDVLSGRARERLQGANGYLSWATHSFGLKPTTRLNHTVILRAAEGGIAGVIASRQLYASHYFHAGLDMRYVVADPAVEDRFVLVMVTRTRSDGLTGFRGAITGGTIRRKALQSLRAYLRYTKQTIEARR